jgi:glycosyltransferase involved in cell wall biosynthesis
MNGRLSLLHHYAWEESGFPQQWAANFNDYLDGITCLSSHVRKILIDNGVFIPLTTSGCGIDHWERLEAEKKFKVSGKSFKFLHVSSCFPRKGANLLLEAFGQTFTKNDDVSLIIKTFVNPHNEIRAQLSSLKDGNPEFPDVIIIEEDLSDSRLKALYEQCDVLVAPSFAEGFGLPLAEAMLSGIPVITTGWGGQTDFCREDTAWLLDYEFQPAVTHLGISASVWAVPDVGKLSETLKKVYTLPVAERQRKAANGNMSPSDYYNQRKRSRASDFALSLKSVGLPLGRPSVALPHILNIYCRIGAVTMSFMHAVMDETKIWLASKFDLRGMKIPVRTFKEHNLP